MTDRVLRGTADGSAEDRARDECEVWPPPVRVPAREGGLRSISRPVREVPGGLTTLLGCAGGRDGVPCLRVPRSGIRCLRCGAVMHVVERVVGPRLSPCEHIAEVICVHPTLTDKVDS